MGTYRTFTEQALHYFLRAHDGAVLQPVKSPADWRAADMSRRKGEWLIQLDAAEIAEISAAVDALVEQNVDMRDVTRESFRLPGLSASIAQWRAEIAQGRGFVVVTGLPVAHWGEKKSAYAFWGIGHHLGVPGAQNPQGELLGHVVDYGEESDNPIVRLYRTTGDIDFHCDAADAVGLLCLHAAKEGGQSRIVSSVAIFNEVCRREPTLIARLFEPFLLDRRDEQGAGEPGYLPIQPCCFSAGQGLQTFYHSEYFRSVERLAGVVIDDDARRLLDLYDELCLSPELQLDMWLKPGDMQFISNHVTLHSRTAYQDWPEPDHKRHLLRLWISL